MPRPLACMHVRWPPSQADAPRRQCLRVKDSQSTLDAFYTAAQTHARRQAPTPAPQPAAPRRRGVRRRGHSRPDHFFAWECQTPAP
eukprot:366040-Chlamydomonas_euryale.AAC.6